MTSDYTPALTETFLTKLREEVFGDCTVVGECYTNAELSSQNLRSSFMTS